MYRVLRDLSSGDKVGDLISGKGINVEALLEARAISLVQAPPLEILPEVSEKAEKLSWYGVEDVDDFMEADDYVLKTALGDIDEDKIEELKEEIKDYIV